MSFFHRRAGALAAHITADPQGRARKVPRETGSRRQPTLRIDHDDRPLASVAWRHASSGVARCTGPSRGGGSARDGLRFERGSHGRGRFGRSGRGRRERRNQRRWLGGRRIGRGIGCGRRARRRRRVLAARHGMLGNLRHGVSVSPGRMCARGSPDVRRIRRGRMPDGFRQLPHVQRLRLRGLPHRSGAHLRLRHDERPIRIPSVQPPPPGPRALSESRPRPERTRCSHGFHWIKESSD
jgi:hypothetical protein